RVLRAGRHPERLAHRAADGGGRPCERQRQGRPQGRDEGRGRWDQDVTDAVDGRRAPDGRRHHAHRSRRRRRAPAPVMTMARSAISRTSRLIPLGAALVAVAVFWIAAPHWLEPKFVNFATLADGSLSDTQSSAIDMVKELNGYLVSTTALLLGGLGWYLSQ